MTYCRFTANMQWVLWIKRGVREGRRLFEGSFHSAALPGAATPQPLESLPWVSCAGLLKGAIEKIKRHESKMFGGEEEISITGLALYGCEIKRLQATL